MRPRQRRRPALLGLRRGRPGRPQTIRPAPAPSAAPAASSAGTPSRINFSPPSARSAPSRSPSAPPTTARAFAAARVRCWGTNHTGRLGDGTTVRTDAVVAVKDLSDATALVAGRLHTCALRKDGRVACWGDGFSGQLGDGTRADRAAPTLVAGLRGATALTAAEDTTCAIGQGQRFMCWGANTGGQLGDGTHVDRYKPVTARVEAVKAAAVGERAACTVTTTTGVVACWGDGLSRTERRWAFIPRPQPVALP